MKHTPPKQYAVVVACNRYSLKINEISVEELFQYQLNIPFTRLLYNSPDPSAVFLRLADSISNGIATLH